MRLPMMEGLEGRRFLSAAALGAGPHGGGLKGPGPADNGEAIHQHDQDRLRDGSCDQAAGTRSGDASAKVGTSDRIRQRLQDGSCAK